MSTSTLEQLEPLTSTQLATLRRCPRQAWFRFELRLIKAALGSPRRMGSAFHEGQEVRNLGQPENVAFEAAMEGYTVCPSWADPMEWATEGEVVRNLLAGHFWRYERDSISLASWLPPGAEEKVPMVELPFRVPLVNPDTGRSSRTFCLAGKIDAFVMLAEARLAILDYKTAGEDIGPDAEFWLRLRCDPQMNLYTIAARHLGLDPACVLYDVTRKPTISPRQVPILDANGRKIVVDAEGNRVLRQNIKKNGEPGAHHGEPLQSASAEKGFVLRTRYETSGEYGERLLSDIADRPDFYYQRREIPLLDDELAAFQAEVWQQAAQLRDCKANGRWFRNVSKWTCQYCDYRNLCLQNVHVDPDAPPPAGFEFSPTAHPELGE